MNMPAHHSIGVKKPTLNKVLGHSKIGIKNKRRKHIMLVCKLMAHLCYDLSVRFGSFNLKNGIAKPKKVQGKVKSTRSFNI